MDPMRSNGVELLGRNQGSAKQNKSRLCVVSGKSSVLSGAPTGHGGYMQRPVLDLVPVACTPPRPTAHWHVQR